MSDTYVDDEDLAPTELPKTPAAPTIDTEIDDPTQEVDTVETEATDPEAPSTSGEQPAKPSRAEARIQKLAALVKEREQELAREREEKVTERTRREMLERFQEANKPPAVDPREEEARVAEMSPEERSAYYLRKTERDLNFKIELMKFENHDNTDKFAFQAKAAKDPRYAKYADEVEKELAALRRTGQNVPRELVLQFVIGRAVLKNEPKAKAQAAKAKENLEAQKAAPVAAKGDQAGAAKLDEKQARLKRLANIPI